MDFKTIRKLLIANQIMVVSLINHYDHYVEVPSAAQTPEYRERLVEGMVTTNYTLRFLPDDSEVLTTIYPDVMEARTALKELIKTQLEFIENIH